MSRFDPQPIRFTDLRVPSPMVGSRCARLTRHEPQRLGVRPPAARADHLPRPGGRRHHRQPDLRPAAAARGRGPEPRHRALHQLARRLGDGRHGHLRHDDLRRLRRLDLRDGPGRVDGAVPALGRHARQALRPAARADPDAPALGRHRRHRVRHRDPGRAVQAHQARDGQADRRAHRPAARADPGRLRARPVVHRGGRRRSTASSTTSSAGSAQVPNGAGPAPA